MQKNKKYRILAYIGAILLIILPLTSSALILADNFVFPIKNYDVVSGFGDDRGGIYHLGEDVMGPAGTPIYSIGNGYVKHIGEHTRFGTVILIEHTLKNASREKIVSLYGHLRLYDVEVYEGQYVNKGQKIGYLGNPEENGGWEEHLHFGIHKGAYVDTWVYWGLTRDLEEMDNWYVPTKFINGFKVANADPNNLTRIISGAGIGGTAHIRLFTKTGEAIKDADFFAFNEALRGGADVAVGNFDKDRRPEILVGAGPGSKPYVKIFDKASQELQKSFLAFDKNFLGGVRVAAGDLDGDGRDEIIAGAGYGGGAHVRVFKANGEVVHSKLFPFGTDQRSGVDVAAGDLDGDKKDEIIVGAGPSGDPRVKVYQENGKITDLNILAYPIAFRGGVRVAAGDIDKDGVDEIITGAGPGGGPHVRVFEGDGTPRAIQYFPFHPNYRGGVDVSSFDYNNDGWEDIIMAQASKGQSWVKVYQYNNEKTVLAEFLAYDENFYGGSNITGLR